jgi:spore coat protein U-like protein
MEMVSGLARRHGPRTAARRMIPAVRLSLALLLSQARIAAEAGTTTANFTVTMTVQATCTISATALNFGVYTGTQLDATSTVTIICTNTTPWYVNLNNGMQYSCCWTNNMISSASAKLNYELFQDIARTQPWQNTVNVDGESGTGSGSGQTLTVYSRVFKGQYVAPGAYSDTVIATVTY